jgi:hypothetical protein
MRIGGWNVYQGEIGQKVAIGIQDVTMAIPLSR